MLKKIQPSTVVYLGFCAYATYNIAKKSYQIHKLEAKNKYMTTFTLMLLHKLSAEDVNNVLMDLQFQDIVDHQ